jgi:tetratricopeptide (TPR) repeat protein
MSSTYNFPAVLWSLIAAVLLSSCTYLPPAPDNQRQKTRKPPVVIQRAKPQAPVRILRTPQPVISQESRDLELEVLEEGIGTEELEYRPPAPASRTQSAENRLYAQAEQHVSAAEFDKAEVSIERALRINPYSPSGYLRLAELNSRNQNWKSAEQLALKAINYAHYHPASQRRALKLAAWQLILEARQSQGNTAGAREAQDKIDELESQMG